VARFLADGLNNGDNLIVIASPQHAAAFSQHLTEQGFVPETLISEERLLLLDPVKTLSLFMKDGRPIAQLFNCAVGTVVQNLRTRSASGEISAYGEMVGVLWSEGFFSAAMDLEDLWNELLSPNHSKLFCSYPIDVFAPGFQACDVEALLCSHSHFIPTEGNVRLERAIYLAMDEVLGRNVDAVRSRMKSDAQVPWAASLRAEAVIVWIRKNLLDSADAILVRARQLYAAGSN